MCGSGTRAFEGFLAGHDPIVSSATFRDGEVLGSWRLTAFLGKGGSGEVYRAENVSDSRVAALKVHIRRSGVSASQQSAAQARFEREARILAANSYPFFPRFYEFGEARGFPYFSMELLAPITLPRGDAGIASFLLELCLAVRTLHGNGFIHRDIKPANIMRRSDGQLVLIDLGLVKESAALAHHTGLSVSIVDGRVVGVGTPRYAAPEQFNGGIVSPATDIHALGMLANECFGGRPPRAWERIISRSTSSIPERRYADVEAFAAAIRRRNRGTWVAWGMLVFALVGLGGVCLRFFGSPAAREAPSLDNLVTTVDTNVVERQVLDEEKETNRFGSALTTESKVRSVTNSVQGSVLRQNGRTQQVAAPILASNSVAVRVPAWRDFAVDVVTNVVERQVFDEKKETNRVGSVVTTEWKWRNVTNSVQGSVLRLNGQTKKFSEPILLDSNRVYWIVGPGTLDAAIDGRPGARVYLDNCVLINRTEKPLKQCGIHYIFRKGSYLNFINQDENDGSWSFIEDFDGAYNALEFRGPETVKEIIRRREAATRQMLDLESW